MTDVSLATPSRPARFTVAGGCPDLRIRSRSDLGRLAELDSSAAWRLEATEEDVTVRAPSFWRALRDGFPFTSVKAEATLDASRAWSLDVHGGATRLDADLRGLELRSLVVRGGLSGAVIALPAPKGTVRVEIHGGVSRLFVLRPSDAAIRVSIRGGASSFEVDELRLGAVSGPVEWASSDAESAENAYELVVRGGASSLVCVRGESSAVPGGSLAPLAFAV